VKVVFVKKIFEKKMSKFSWLFDIELESYLLVANLPHPYKEVFLVYDLAKFSQQIILNATEKWMK